MVEILLFIGAGAGVGAGEKNPEPVRNSRLCKTVCDHLLFWIISS